MREGFAKPHIERALLWGLCEAPIQSRLCKAPRDFLHTYTHFGLCLQVLGVLHYGGFIKPLYTRGLAVRALYIHTNTHFGLFSYRYGGALLWRPHEAPLWKGFYYEGFAKPHIEKGFAMGALYTHTYTHIYILVFFPQIQGVLHYGGFASPSIEGAS